MTPFRLFNPCTGCLMACWRTRDHFFFKKITFLPDISTNHGLPTFGETVLRGIFKFKANSLPYLPVQLQLHDRDNVVRIWTYRTTIGQIRSQHRRYPTSSSTKLVVQSSKWHHTRETIVSYSLCRCVSDWYKCMYRLVVQRNKNQPQRRIIPRTTSQCIKTHLSHWQLRRILNFGIREVCYGIGWLVSFSWHKNRWNNWHESYDWRGTPYFVTFQSKW